MPLLRPLDLTKEITHRGETFVPIVELLKMIHPREDYNTRYGIIEVSTDGYPEAWYAYSAMHRIQVRTSEMQELSTWITNKLHTWMFDTQNLIGQNLAIDVNTLEFNPYEK
jgi:hypothetical protein